MSIANELIVRGWAQGTVEDDEGRVCLRGAAVCAVTGFSPNQLDSLDGWRSEVIDAYEVLDRVCGMSTPLFNDAAGRTYDEVLRAAKEADEILGAVRTTDDE